MVCINAQFGDFNEIMEDYTVLNEIGSDAEPKKKKEKLQAGFFRYLFMKRDIIRGLYNFFKVLVKHVIGLTSSNGTLQNNI